MTAVIAFVLAVAAPALVTQRAAASTIPMRIEALRWAEHQAGKWYCWGGAGPSCYDCSGLVMKAWEQAGVTLPHSTYSILHDPRFVIIPVSQARRGDLMFYGSGHVELKTRNGTFGALQTGTRIGWHHPSPSWHPTLAMRLR